MNYSESFSPEVQKHVAEQSHITKLRINKGTRCIGISDGGTFITTSMQKTCFFEWTDVLRWDVGIFILHNMDNGWSGMSDGPYMEFILPKNTKHRSHTVDHMRVSVRDVLALRDDNEPIFLWNLLSHIRILLKSREISKQLVSSSLSSMIQKQTKNFYNDTADNIINKKFQKQVHFNEKKIGYKIKFDDFWLPETK